MSYNKSEVDKIYIEILRKITTVNGMNKDKILKSLEENLTKLRNKIYDLENKISCLKKYEITYEDLINYLKKL